MLIDALSVLCAQLTRDLLAIAKFLFYQYRKQFLMSFGGQHGPFWPPTSIENEKVFIQ